MIVIVKYKPRSKTTEVEESRKGKGRKRVKKHKVLKGNAVTRKRKQLLSKGFIEYDTAKSNVFRFQTPDEKPYVRKSATRTIAGLKGVRDPKRKLWNFRYLSKGVCLDVVVKNAPYAYIPWRAYLNDELLARGMSLVEVVTEAKLRLCNTGLIPMTAENFIDDIIAQAKNAAKSPHA